MSSIVNRGGRDDGVGWCLVRVFEASRSRSRGDGRCEILAQQERDEAAPIRDPAPRRRVAGDVDVVLVGFLVHAARRLDREARDLIFERRVVQIGEIGRSRRDAHGLLLRDRRVALTVVRAAAGDRALPVLRIDVIPIVRVVELLADFGRAQYQGPAQFGSFLLSDRHCHIKKRKLLSVLVRP